MAVTTPTQAMHLMQWLQDCLPSEDCRTCEAFQALVNQLEADAFTDDLLTFEVPPCHVHGRCSRQCCLPDAVFTAYLREQHHIEPPGRQQNAC